MAKVARMTTPLEAWALAALQTLPVFHEDVGAIEKAPQLAMMAQAITEAVAEQPKRPLSKQQLMAADMTIAWHESTLSLRIHRNECDLKKHECDNGRAISSFQLHANALTSTEVWPTLGYFEFASTKLAAKEATRAFVKSYWYCKAAGVEGDPIALAFTAYAGRGCQLDKWQGWRVRLKTFNHLLSVPMPASQKQG